MAVYLSGSESEGRILVIRHLSNVSAARPFAPSSCAIHDARLTYDGTAKQRENAAAGFRLQPYSGSVREILCSR